MIFDKFYNINGCFIFKRFYLFIQVVKVNKKTRVEGIELIGRVEIDYNEWWKRLRSNKNLVDFILSQMDPNLKEIVLRDNPKIG